MKFKQNEIDDPIEIEEIHVMCFTITDKDGKFDVSWSLQVAELLLTDEFNSVFETIDRVRLNVLASLSKAEISRDVNAVSAFVMDSMSVDLNAPFISKQFQKLGF